MDQSDRRHGFNEEETATQYTSMISPLPVAINEPIVSRRYSNLAETVTSIAPCMESPGIASSPPTFLPGDSAEDIFVVTEKGVRIQHGRMQTMDDGELSQEEENINHFSTRSSWSYRGHQQRVAGNSQHQGNMTPVYSEHQPDAFHSSTSAFRQRREQHGVSMKRHQKESYDTHWRNSFFGFRLITSSVILIAVAIGSLVLHELTASTNHWCTNLIDATKTSRVVVISALVDAVLVIPALFPSYCGLYRVSKLSKVIRRPFLQICEIVVVGQIVVCIIQLLLWLFRMVEKPQCPVNLSRSTSWTDSLIIYVKLWSILPLLVLVWWQIQVFCLFRTHLKLQIGSANDSKHSANLKGWLKRLFTLPTFGRRNQVIRDLRTGLFKAAITGDLDTAQRLLDDATRFLGRGFAIKKLYHEPQMWFWAFARSRKNPLHVAVARGDIPMVELFMKFRFDVNALDKVSRVNFNFGLFFKWTRLIVTTQDYLQPSNGSLLYTVLVSPLHVAVQQGQIEAVRILLNHNADVNTLPRASFFYPSAVKPAIYFADHVQVMKLLLAHQSNHLYVASSSSSVLTPLQRNVLTFRTAQSALLEEHGCDVALTPLHAAAAANDAPTVLKLLRQGVDPDCLGELVCGIHLRTALHWAAITGSTECAKHLLAHQAQANAVDRLGRTPLHWAARHNHLQVVQLLLQHGANPNFTDNDNYPVLYVAAQAEGVSAEVVSELVEAGADKSYRDMKDGNTPLHIALINENRTTAVSLLRNGADIMATNYKGQRAVDCTTSTELQFAVKKEAGSRDVMISYTHAHSPIAKGVRDYLVEHARMTCWMDTMDPSGIGGGAVWREEIARGIHNAKVVVAVVCDGYSRSEWCLKELAFAKLAKIPTVVLVIDSNGMSSEIQRYVPEEFIIPFESFDPSDPIFPEHILETIRTAMQTKGSWLIPAAPSSDLLDVPYRRVFICFNKLDGLVDRMIHSLRGRGYHPMTASVSMSELDLREGIDHANLIISSSIIFILGPDWHMKANLHGVTKAITFAEQHNKKLIPIAVGDQCLDFSRLYSLSRTAWFPFVNGVNFERSFEHLAMHLSQELPLLAFNKRDGLRPSHSDYAVVNFFDDGELATSSLYS